MAYVKLRPRRGTASAWEYANPILAEGEMAFEVPDTGVGTGLINIKQGDGQTSWVNLPYAFNGATLNNKVDELTNTVATYDGRINTIENQVADMQSKVLNIRKIDIQATEPTDNLALGQIWINSDMITGSMVVEPSTVSLQVGSEIRFTLINSLTAYDTIQWTISDDVSAILYNTSSTGCSVRANMAADNVRLTAKALKNGSVVYSAYAIMSIVVDGGLVIAPIEQKIIIGSSKRYTLTNTLTSFDSIVWSSSASYLANVENYSDTYADVKGLVGGTATIYARALLNGSYIADATALAIIAGATLNKSTVTLDLHETDTLILALVNLEQGTDYTTITWESTDNAKVQVVGTGEGGKTCNIQGVAAGRCNVQATIYNGTEIVQRLQALVVVSGQITIDPASVSLLVGQTSALTLNNSLETGTWDPPIVWESNDNSIAAITVSTDSSAQIRAAGAGNTLIVARAYKNGAEVATSSCVVSVQGTISIDGDAIRTVAEGTTITLTCTNTLAPSQWAEIRWQSNAGDVCRITSQSASECQVECRSAGTAVITVKAMDDDDQVVASSTCTINVTE